MKQSNLLHRRVSQPILYDKQQNIEQEVIPDRKEVLWDLTEAQSGILVATPEIGDTRMIVNKSLGEAVKGSTYILEYWQDSVGGRKLTFDSSFLVRGEVDLSPNSVSFIKLHITRDYAKVDIQKGNQTYLETTDGLDGFKRISSEEFEQKRLAGELIDEIVYIVEKNGVI
jgi:hypothetical protein